MTAKGKDKLKPVEEVEPKKLTELEVVRLEMAQMLSEFRQNEKRLIDLQARNIELQKENFALRLKSLEIDQVKNNEDKQALGKRAMQDKVNTVELHTKIKDRLGIECARFGYNPDTLEVITEG